MSTFFNITVDDGGGPETQELAGRIDAVIGSKKAVEFSFRLPTCRNTWRSVSINVETGEIIVTDVPQATGQAPEGEGAFFISPRGDRKVTLPPGKEDSHLDYQAQDPIISNDIYG